MYGVNSKMNEFGSTQTLERGTSRNDSLSPELREVLHMLEAIEQNAAAGKPAK